jgi:hypothetical protein
VIARVTQLAHRGRRTRVSADERPPADIE